FSRILKRKRQPEGCLFHFATLSYPSVSNRASSTQTGLGTHELREETSAFCISGFRLVGNREEPDTEESDDDREQRRVGVREDRLGIAQHLHPHGRAENSQDQCGKQAHRTANKRTPNA